MKKTKKTAVKALIATLRGGDDFTPPEKCQTRDGKVTGDVVSWKYCTLEGCRGHRIGVRWPNGKLTWPCLKGVKWLSKTKVRVL